MCNPRQVHVTATRQLAESWDHEVSRQVTLTGQAVGRASVREPVGDQLGHPVLVMLDRALGDSDAWEETDGGFRTVVDGGYGLYHPDTGELEIVAELNDDVQAQGRAAETVRAEVDALIEAEGVGRYWDDGYGGRDRAAGRRDAEAAAARSLEQVAAQRLAEARRRAEEGASDAVRQRAEAEAEAALAAAVEARVAELRRLAADRLGVVGAQIRLRLNQGIAHATHLSLLAYARSRGAQGLQVDEVDGRVRIRFEMEY